MSVQLPQHADVGRRRRPRLVWVDAEDGEDAVVPLGAGKGLPAVLQICADRQDPLHACPGGARHCLVGVVEGAEVRVRVDHESSDARTASASSLRKSGLGSSSVWPGGSSLGAQEPTQLV
jgi:hypothetical protein